MNKDQEKPVWGVRQIAALFGVKEPRVWKWIERNAEETTVMRKSDGKWYAFPSEVEAYLRSPDRLVR